MGKAIERADQTSRLVDIGYRRAILSGHEYESRALDSHWNTMLRSSSGYQAFCGRIGSACIPTRFWNSSCSTGSSRAPSSAASTRRTGS